MGNKRKASSEIDRDSGLSFIDFPALCSVVYYSFLGLHEKVDFTALVFLCKYYVLS